MQTLPLALYTGGAGGAGGGDPSFASVRLLVDWDGSNGATTETDESGSPATLTFAGAAALSNSQAKFGTTSLSLSGAASQYVTTNRTMGITTGQFTMECHVRPSVAQTGRILSAQDITNSNPVIAYRVNSAGSVTFILRNSAGGGTLVLTSGTTPVAMNNSAWYHIACTRDGSNNINIWLDGASIASSSSSTNPNGAPAYNIGAFRGNTGGTAQEPFGGFLANLRLTEGVCRYTAGFTPPSAKYPTS